MCCPFFMENLQNVLINLVYILKGLYLIGSQFYILDSIFLKACNYTIDKYPISDYNQYVSEVGNIQFSQ